MSDADLWDIERSLWLEGVAAFEAHMDPACVMAFPPPAGLMQGPEILAGLAGAPRWRELDVQAPHVARPGDDCAVLAYLAVARRASGPTYRAYCTSTYWRRGDRWRLIQHQQTAA